MKNKDENSVKQTPSAVVTREATMPEPSLSEGPETDIHPLLTSSRLPAYIDPVCGI